MSSKFDQETRTAPVRESTDDVRQAVAPHRLRYMLGFGIAGVVIAFAIIYIAFVAG